jgi:competence protein ComEA
MDQSATPWRVFDAPGPESDASGQHAASPNQRGGEPAAAAAGFDLTTPAARRVLAGIGLAVAIGGIAVAVALSGAGGQVVDGPDRSLVGAEGAGLLAGGDIVVDVTGAVARPGLYHLAAGSRVGDAIEAAGGFGPRVDADRIATTLNLAAALVDGSQVHVPARGEAGPESGSGGDAGTGAAGGTLVNLNTATQSELESLPGIGPVTATKIIDSRAGAPFTSIDQLRERGLVGEKTFQQLESLVSVR